jgi:hypothetical protein
MPGDTKAAFDPRVPLLLLLSTTTGLVDAASVLGLGKVFTANMTGNVVFHRELHGWGHARGPHRQGVHRQSRATLVAHRGHR